MAIGGVRPPMAAQASGMLPCVSAWKGRLPVGRLAVASDKRREAIRGRSVMEPTMVEYGRNETDGFGRKERTTDVWPERSVAVRSGRVARAG
jgi:hypothetical protein